MYLGKTKLDAIDPAGTRRHWNPPKGHLKVLTFGTYSREDFQKSNKKNDNLTTKLYFGSNSLYITYLLLYLRGGAKIA